MGEESPTVRVNGHAPEGVLRDLAGSPPKKKELSAVEVASHRTTVERRGLICEVCGRLWICHADDCRRHEYRPPVYGVAERLARACRALAKVDPACIPAELVALHRAYGECVAALVGYDVLVESAGGEAEK